MLDLDLDKRNVDIESNGLDLGEKSLDLTDFDLDLDHKSVDLAEDKDLDHSNRDNSLEFPLFD